jgi:hypothetical protein
MFVRRRAVGPGTRPRGGARSRKTARSNVTGGRDVVALSGQLGAMSGSDGTALARTTSE